eukprot:TRINITY_DN6635_c0_g1_i4.p1 TRINITY_DN6635_c0_g1~~TRINITY_DN6635_c0_g1_i4.p1  ORF type:complete len:145 (+),score=27.12 TRINITY_DN6635_c0_g1_i4:132-566(+)
MDVLPVLCALCVHCVLYSGVTAASSSQEFRKPDPQINDVNFTDHVLFPFSTVRSLLDCVRQCAGRERCRAFTFVPGPGSCQGYYVRPASGDSHVDLPHARTFNSPTPPIPGKDTESTMQDEGHRPSEVDRDSPPCRMRGTAHPR